MDTEIINKANTKNLNITELFKTETTETLLVTLEAKKLFPKHTSPKDTMVVVLEGSINFYIENKLLALDKHEIYIFKKGIEHYVTANENSKFLIIR